MSAQLGLRESLSRVGVSLVLHMNEGARVIYGDVAGPVQPDGSFRFEAWGVRGPLVLRLGDVKSATAPDIGFKAYREIRARQRDAFAHEQEKASR